MALLAFPLRAEHCLEANKTDSLGDGNGVPFKGALGDGFIMNT